MMMDAIENLGPALVVFEGGDFWRHKFLLRTYFKNFMFDMRVGLPTADATGARSRHAVGRKPPGLIFD